MCPNSDARGGSTLRLERLAASECDEPARDSERRELLVLENAPIGAWPV